MRTSRIFPSSQKVAEAFAEELVEYIEQESEFHLVLSGGSTPKLLFSYLAEHYVESVDWTNVHLYWGDERCVPPTHADSNYGMTYELLLQHIGIPASNVHRIRGEDDPEQEAKRYAEEIAANVPMENGLPVFDLIILGMGSDGHTASIFPHEIELLKSEAICAVAAHPESGQKRVSLTGPVINQASNISFLVTGASKTERIREIWSGAPESQQYPATFIDPTDGELYWYLDEAAAQGIPA